MGYAWALALGAVLLFVLAGAELQGFVDPSMVLNLTASALAVFGILLVIAAAAVRAHDEGSI